jgi:hypothetical protein
MKVVGCQPYAPAAFIPRINLVLIFRGWVDPRAHGTMPRKKPGLDPGTFRLVAQCLNHYATPGPYIYIYIYIYDIKLYYDSSNFLTLRSVIPVVYVELKQTNMNRVSVKNTTVFVTHKCHRHVPPSLTTRSQHRSAVTPNHPQPLTTSNTARPPVPLRANGPYPTTVELSHY